MGMGKQNKSKILPLVAGIFMVASFLGYQILSGSSPVFAADSIESIEKDIKKQQSDLDKLNQELSGISSSVNSTQAQITKTEVMVKEAIDNINKKKKELDLLSGRISIQKEALKNILQEFYYNQKEPIIYSMLNEEDLSKAFSEADRILTLNQRVYDTINDINQSKEDVETQKQAIETARQEH